MPGLQVKPGSGVAGDWADGTNPTDQQPSSGPDVHGDLPVEPLDPLMLAEVLEAMTGRLESLGAGRTGSSRGTSYAARLRRSHRVGSCTRWPWRSPPP